MAKKILKEKFHLLLLKSLIFLRMEIMVMAQNFKNFILLVFSLLISLNAQSGQIKEIIRYGHDVAEKKCQKAGEKIHKEYFQSITYKKTGKKRYVSRYHQNCEESVCEVNFSQESWQYKKEYVVCSLPQNKIEEEDKKVSFAKAASIKYKSRPQIKRTIASVKKESQDKVDLKLSCQGLVQDINSWLQSYSLNKSSEQKKENYSQYVPLTPSLSAKKVANEYYRKTKDETLKQIETNLEIMKLKMKELKTKELLQSKWRKSIAEYNGHIQEQFNKYLEIAKEYCFNELLENRAALVKEVHSPHREMASTPHMKQEEFINNEYDVEFEKILNN